MKLQKKKFLLLYLLVFGGYTMFYSRSDYSKKKKNYDFVTNFAPSYFYGNIFPTVAITSNNEDEKEYHD